jgi:hypothetical protein
MTTEVLSPSPKNAIFPQSSVDRLLFASGPFAIVRRVIAIVVDSLYCQSDRRKPHIRQKVLETFPALANLYSSSAIILESLDRWVSTSVTHGLPHIVDPSFAHGVRRGSFSKSQSTTATATGFTIAVSEAPREKWLLYAAITSTNPFSRRVSRTGDFVYGS